ncbi:element excision factor XisH family protein [Leptolyngbya boryana CZ1]|uniref:Element excision factor XisH family protein n=1 Tax=Leptolyngbya boryana CZ1 TaxID=3060204 RepID=A0AA96WVL0_LEPBY|nr:element excision factor XisH family protein [Leptolyngbya boryana]WNZ46341.1 element excision factor XisH family protein [Leptolyngbya boryana CZ1]
MPARDLYHAVVRQALVKANWKITNDPLPLAWKGRNLQIDLGAEEWLTAEKQQKKIAVEVKSFLRESRVADLEQALGQYTLYEAILNEVEPDREVYLAMPIDAYAELFEGDQFAQILVATNRLKVLVFRPQTEEIIQWIP